MGPERFVTECIRLCSTLFSSLDFSVGLMWTSAVYPAMHMDSKHTLICILFFFPQRNLPFVNDFVDDLPVDIVQRVFSLFYYWVVPFLLFFCNFSYFVASWKYFCYAIIYCLKWLRTKNANLQAWHVTQTDVLELGFWNIPSYSCRDHETLKTITGPKDYLSFDHHEINNCFTGQMHFLQIWS